MYLNRCRHGIKELFDTILVFEDRINCMNETEGTVTLDDWQFELDMLKKLAQLNPEDIDSFGRFYDEMLALSDWYREVAGWVESELPVVKQVRDYEELRKLDIDRNYQYVPELDHDKQLRAKGTPRYIKIGETWYVVDPKYFYTGLHGMYCSDKNIGPSNDVVEQECIIDNCFAYPKN